MSWPSPQGFARRMSLGWGVPSGDLLGAPILFVFWGTSCRFFFVARKVMGMLIKNVFFYFWHY